MEFLGEFGIGKELTMTGMVHNEEFLVLINVVGKPVAWTLSEEDVDKVIDSLKSFKELATQKVKDFGGERLWKK